MRYEIIYVFKSGNCCYAWLHKVFIGLMLIIGITLLAVWLFQHSKNGQYQDNSTKAMEILKRRYSLGEMSNEEFQQKRKDILS